MSYAPDATAYDACRNASDPGGAEVLDAAHGLALELEGLGERDATAALRGTEPVRVDVLLGEPDRRQRLVDGLHHQIIGAEVPVLAEIRAPNTDDGDAIANAV